SGGCRVRERKIGKLRMRRADDAAAMPFMRGAVEQTPEVGFDRSPQFFYLGIGFAIVQRIVKAVGAFEEQQGPRAACLLDRSAEHRAVDVHGSLDASIVDAGLEGRGAAARPAEGTDVVEIEMTRQSVATGLVEFRQHIQRV